VASPENVVGLVIHLAAITPSDVFLDLGCGDGAVLLQVAVRCGCRCLGIDVRPECLDAVRQGALQRGVGHLVEAAQLDMMTELEQAESWREATVVYGYVMPHMNRDNRLQLVLQRAIEGGGKRVALYCSSGSRVRKPGAPEAGNKIGDLVPAAQACLGMLRMYAAEATIERLPALKAVCDEYRERHPPPAHGTNFALLGGCSPHAGGIEPRTGTGRHAVAPRTTATSFVSAQAGRYQHHLYLS